MQLENLWYLNILCDPFKIFPHFAFYTPNVYFDKISRQARNDIRALDGITTLSSRPSVTSGEIPKISRQARNDGAARGEPNVFGLSRVATSLDVIK